MTPQEIQDIFERRRAERKRRNRIWICVVLSVLAFVIFIANRYVTAVQQKKTQATVRQEGEVIRSKIEAEIDTVLESFGIEKDWIHKRAVRLSKKDFVRYEEYVSLSPDIPIAYLNLDLSTMAKKYNARATAVENARSGTIAVHINVKGNVLQSIILSVDPELRRNVGNIALIIDKIENASDEALNTLLQRSHEHIAYGLTPNRKTTELFRKVAEAEKELFLVITIRGGDDKDLFTLSSDLDESKTRWRLKGILNEFDKATGCLVISDKPKSTAVEIIRQEMERRRLLFLQISDVKYANASRDSVQLDRWLHDLAEMALKAPQKSIIGVIPWESNLISLLENELRILRKRGFEFVTVSDIKKQGAGNK